MDLVWSCTELESYTRRRGSNGRRLESNSSYNLDLLCKGRACQTFVFLYNSVKLHFLFILFKSILRRSW